MKDSRYNAAKLLIQANQVSDLKQIFDFLPISVVAKDAKMNYSTLYRKVNDIDTFTIGDLKKLAKLIEVDFMQLLRAVANTAQKESK